MSELKSLVTDLPTSIRLKELGVEQKGRLFYHTIGVPGIEIAMQILNMTEQYAALTLSEVLELIDWKKCDISAPINDNKWWVCGMDEDFEGNTLLEAATKALIHQLENK